MFIEDLATLRVSNLSEEVTEPELRKLFGKFGPIHRVYLATDKVTGVSKGFAFITYRDKRDADVALERLNGVALDHLILNVERAK